MTLDKLVARASPSFWRAAVLLPHAAAMAMLVLSLKKLTRYSKKLAKKENPFPKGSVLHDMAENEYEAFHKSETVASRELMQICWFGIIHMAAVLAANVMVLYSTTRNVSRSCVVCLAKALGAEGTECVLGNAIVFFALLFTVYIAVFRVSFSWKTLMVFLLFVGLHAFLAARGVFVDTRLSKSGMYSRQYNLALVLLLCAVVNDYVLPVLLVHERRFDIRRLSEKAQRIVEEAGFRDKILDVSPEYGKINAACYVVGFFRPICLIGNIAAKLSVEDLSGVLCHEIGHSQDRVLVLLQHAFTFAYPTAYALAPHFFARVCDAAIADTHFRLVSLDVLYCINFFSVAMACAALTNVFARRGEYFADRYSFEKMPEGDIRKGLFHMSLCNNTPVYSPAPLVVLFSTHPSVHMRILSIK